MLSTLSIYGSHDASVTFVDKNDEIKVLEYERFVNQRYGAFTQRLDHRNGLRSNDEKRNLFFPCLNKQEKAN